MTKIEVTEADIDAAIPKDSGHCAIADAIARQVSGATRVTVDLQTIRWTDSDKGERYTYLTPRAAQVLLLDFDQGEREYCRPLTFRLDRPIHVNPVTTNSGPATRARRAAQAERVAALTSKRDNGDELTRDEKRTLSRAVNRATSPEAVARPTSPGPRTVDVTAGSADPDGAPAVVVRGGQPAPIGALAHGRGRTRVFGLKSAGSPAPGLA
jgi:hypothetical protein